MPRQDVPYGGAICRLKERIAEIWDKLGEKLHSVNGVTGDAAGNVEIVSGDAAITISEDQVNHTIEIGMDRGELPSAAVTSVNGQTGAVVLDATDIRTTNNTPIQTKITALEGATQTALNNINTEAQNRQAADNILQGNINSVQASIPGAAATAVANDPTVAQLAADVPNKVDKITSGSSLKAYTHTGATQGETSIVDGTAANSIGIRDANGRMQAADPASGATDKTLVTTNWVSQTGSGRPNNLLHDTGNELIDGRKSAAFVNNNFCEVDAFTTSRVGWHKLFEIKSKERWMGKLIITRVSNSYGLARAAFKEIFLYMESTSSGAMYWIENIGKGSFSIRLTFDGSEWAIWVNCGVYIRHYFQLESMCYVWGVNDAIYHVASTWNDVVTEPAAADYQVYINTVSNP